MNDKEKLQDVFDKLSKIRDKLGVLQYWQYVGNDFTDVMIGIMELANYDIDTERYKD